MSKKRVSSYDAHPFRIEWLPKRYDLRTTTPIIPIVSRSLINKKTKNNKKLVNRSQKHIILKAVEWQAILDEGKVSSLSQIAKIEGLTRARVTQIMKLLKLPIEVKEFLTGLQDPGEIRR